MDRLVKVAEFLDVPLEYFYSANINKPKRTDELDPYIASLKYIKDHWTPDRFDFLYTIIRNVYLHDHPEDEDNIC